MSTCRLCGADPSKDPVRLERVNETGAPGIWECRPSCGSGAVSDDERLIAAVEGERLPEPRMTVDLGARPAATPEPPPVPNDKPALWELVIADVEEMDLGTVGVWATVVHDMRARDAFGRAKYGTPLQAGNGRDALVDAYQEALDLCVYLKQSLVEKYDGRVWAHYRDALNMAVGLASLIAERGR